MSTNRDETFSTAEEMKLDGQLLAKFTLIKNEQRARYYHMTKDDEKLTKISDISDTLRFMPMTSDNPPYYETYQELFMPNNDNNNFLPFFLNSELKYLNSHP